MANESRMKAHTNFRTYNAWKWPLFEVCFSHENLSSDGLVCNTYFEDWTSCLQNICPSASAVLWQWYFEFEFSSLGFIRFPAQVFEGTPECDVSPYRVFWSGWGLFMRDRLFWLVTVFGKGEWTRHVTSWVTVHYLTIGGLAWIGTVSFMATKGTIKA